jgi:hypothetical protein
MNPEEKLNLKRLIDNSDCENNTDTIRRVKHSVKIRDDIRRLENLKKTDGYMRATDPAEFLELCKKQAWFLFSNYTDIFNKILKDELDLGIMSRLLAVLKMIEDSKVDQHEGSVMVGKILKELYVDSALKRGENLDREDAETKLPPVEGKKISWNEFKHLNEK